MQYAIKLHNYLGESGLAMVPNQVVDSLYLVIHYTVSGDDIYLFITDTGEIHGFDASDYIENSPERIIDCGPEDIRVIFPEDMKWATTNEA